VFPAVGQDEFEQAAEAVVAIARHVHLGAVLALALGVRGDGADLLYGLAEAAVVELLAAGGVDDLDQAADLVGAVAAFALRTRIFKERLLRFIRSISDLKPE
jgi:hypothetical protein